MVEEAEEESRGKVRRFRKERRERGREGKARSCH